MVPRTSGAGFRWSGAITTIEPSPATNPLSELGAPELQADNATTAATATRRTRNASGPGDLARARKQVAGRLGVLDGDQVVAVVSERRQ